MTFTSTRQALATIGGALSFWSVIFNRSNCMARFKDVGFSWVSALFLCEVMYPIAAGDSPLASSLFASATNNPNFNIYRRDDAFSVHELGCISSIVFAAIITQLFGKVW